MLSDGFLNPGCIGLLRLIRITYSDCNIKCLDLRYKGLACCWEVPVAEISLSLYNSSLSCDVLETDGPRELGEGDFRLFDQWSESYRDILARQSDPAALLKLGEEMYAWLDGDPGWLERIKQNCASPLKPSRKLNRR